MLLASIVLDLIRWIEPAFVVAGYFIVAGGVFLERSIFIGLVVPGDILLALGGVYASQGRLSLAAVAIIGTLAAVAGESAGYWLGRRYGRTWVSRIPVASRLQRWFDGAADFFERHGGKTVAIGRYATAAGAFIPFTAGVARMPYPRFLLFDVPAIAIWAVGISAFGYLFGRNLEFVDTVVSRFGWTVLGILLAFVAGWFGWKKWRDRGVRNPG